MKWTSEVSMLSVEMNKYSSDLDFSLATLNNLFDSSKRRISSDWGLPMGEESREETDREVKVKERTYGVEPDLVGSQFIVKFGIEDR
jgi:hypothetical protein